MEIALQTSGPATQPHEGLGLRLVRRLGGAVRSVFTRNTARTGCQRGTPTPQPDTDASASPIPETPPAPEHAPRRRRTRRTMSRRQVREYLYQPEGDTFFTPQTFPGMSPEAYAFFNTPLEDCDPAAVEAILGALAQAIAAAMPADSGLGDADAVFATLWGRLSPALNLPGPDASLPAAEASAAEALPPALEPQDTLPPAPDAPDTLRAAPDPSPQPESSPQIAPCAPGEASIDALLAAVLPFEQPSAGASCRVALASATALTPPAALPAAFVLPAFRSVLRRSRSVLHGARSVLHCSRFVLHGARSVLHCSRSVRHCSRFVLRFADLLRFGPASAFRRLWRLLCCWCAGFRRGALEILRAARRGWRPRRGCYAARASPA